MNGVRISVDRLLKKGVSLDRADMVRRKWVPCDRLPDEVLVRLSDPSRAQRLTIGAVLTMPDWSQSGLGVGVPSRVI